MFSLRRPSESLIHSLLDSARNLPLNYTMPFITQNGAAEGAQLPPSFARDHTRTEIGHGEAAFQTAKAAMRQWQHFDLGWVRIANPDARIATGQIVAVEAHTLGLWSLNISRILYVIDETTRFGFGYGTTQLHVESGEEQFLVERNPTTGEVSYDLLAISRPAHWLARLGYPYTRSQQRRFARHSHRRMQQLVSAPSSLIPAE